MKQLLYTFLSICCPFLGASQAVITAVFDADLPGGLPKGVEIYLLQDVADVSLLGVGSANNGEGSDGVEYTFPPTSADAGSYFYVTSDSASFRDFFGFNADAISSAASINGDDAMELFWDSTVVDVFGDIAVDGSGQPWEYTDGWAARKALTGPDGSSFVLQNWYFSGVAGLDGETSNGTAANPVPLKSYTDTTSTGPDVVIILQNLMFLPQDVTVEKGQTVRWTNVETNEEHNVNGRQEQFPCNPTGFYSGEAEVGEWDFDFTFNVAGIYNYQCDPHVSHGMIGKITVVDPLAPAYPLYEIDLVHTEDVNGIADSNGVTCTLQGVVHGPNFRPAGLQFTIIDVAEGKGINVFKTNEDCYNVNEGDLVAVRGVITQFNGLTEILPSEAITVLSSPNQTMNPLVTSTPLNESLESTLVRVEDLMVDSIIATGSSGWNMFTSNASDVQYLVRLDADVIGDGMIYSGKVVDVTGIVSQFDDEEPYDAGYQLQPRGEADVVITVGGVKTLPASAIRIYPNPVTDICLLTSDLAIQTLEILQLDGKKISTVEFPPHEINLSWLAPGSYVMVAQTQDGVWSAVFTKE